VGALYLHVNERGCRYGADCERERERERGLVDENDGGCEMGGLEGVKAREVG
jgi:hypothetical protein